MVYHYLGRGFHKYTRIGGFSGELSQKGAGVHEKVQCFGEQVLSVMKIVKIQFLYI